MYGATVPGLEGKVVLARIPVEAGGFLSEGGRTARLVAIGLLALLVAYVGITLWTEVVSGCFGELQNSREG